MGVMRKQFVLMVMIFVGANCAAQKEAGEGVVRQATTLADRVSKAAGISPIGMFLRRIAKTESNLGKTPGTFRPGYYGGIWQVDKIAYEETKNPQAHPGLLRLYRAIGLILPGVDWPQTSWSDCINPVYSCLAARLYLAIIPEPVPDTLEGQARYWKKYYNTALGQGTEAQFIQANEG